MSQDTPAAPQPPPRLDDDARQVLELELDTLRDLFQSAEASAQSIFNFYLTLVSTVVGGIVLLGQFGGDIASARTRLLIMVLLLFSTAVGTVYHSSLVGRYGHLARYARGVDILRRILITRSGIDPPPGYEELLSDAASEGPGRAGNWFAMLYPAGSYQAFVAAVNSLSLVGAMWLFLSLSGVIGEQLVAVVITVAVVFVVLFTIHNIYAHTMLRFLSNRLGVRVDMGRDARYFAGRQ